MDDRGLRQVQARLRGYSVRNALVLKVRRQFLALVERLEHGSTCPRDTIDFPRDTICKPISQSPSPEKRLGSESDILRELQWARSTLRSRLNYLESQNQSR